MDERFTEEFTWQEALLRMSEREPELCEQMSALATEHGLFAHPDDPRRGCEALKRAIATEEGRKVVGAFSHALIKIQNEIADELRGSPLQRHTRSSGCHHSAESIGFRRGVGATM